MTGTELSFNSANSGNLINHWSMNWAQFKDPVFRMCLVGAVVASWSLTQQVAGWQVRALLMEWQIVLSLNSGKSLKTFRENSILWMQAQCWGHSEVVGMQKHFLQPLAPSCPLESAHARTTFNEWLQWMNELSDESSIFQTQSYYLVNFPRELYANEKIGRASLLP